MEALEEFKDQAGTDEMEKTKNKHLYCQQDANVFQPLSMKIQLDDFGPFTMSQLNPYHRVEVVKKWGKEGVSGIFDPQNYL